MDASIASERASFSPLKALSSDPLKALAPNPLRALALTAGGVAAAALVFAAMVLMVRWALGAIGPRTAGGFIAIASATLVLIAAAAAGLRPMRPRTASAGGLLRSPERGDSSVTDTSRDDQAKPPPSADPASSPPRWPEAKLMQRIDRYERQGPDGSISEAAVGHVVVRFPSGSRVAVAHVGFCPPFTSTPRVAVSNECDGLEVDVAAPEVLPWGVRIECRLEEPSEEPLDVDVELVAEPVDARERPADAR